MRVLAAQSEIASKKLQLGNFYLPSFSLKSYDELSFLIKGESMSKFLALSVTFLGASLIAMSFSLAADQCDADANGFLSCAEGQVAQESIQQDSQSLLHNASYHPRRGRHYPAPYPNYPPPAPFCYTRSGFCRMVVATPPGTYCTCNFGYFWDSGVTGY